jgi:hypothetical protein
MFDFHFLNTAAASRVRGAGDSWAVTFGLPVGLAETTFQAFAFLNSWNIRN